MLDLDIITDDFSRKYQGTFVRWQKNEDSNKEVVLITRVDSAEDRLPLIRISHPKYKDLIVSYDSLSSLDFEWPPVGYFNHDGKALIFSRWIARQWKKGICTTNSQIRCPYESVAKNWFHCNRTYFKLGTNVSFGNLESVFQNVFCSFEQAIEKLSQGEVLSSALTSWMALGLNTGESSNILLLWFHQTPIGYYLLNEKRMVVFVEAFKQEVKDYFSRNNIGAEIV